MSIGSAVITVHRQGRILVPTLRSLFAAQDHARRHGHDIEFVVVADRADTLTRAILARHADRFAVLNEADVGDPGAARQLGVALARHERVFFHDADDLYSEDWYTKFLDFADQRPQSNAILHGQVMVGFGVETYFRLQTSTRDLGFEPMALTCQWFFATNLMTPRSVALAHPIPTHNARSGVGHDDWAWSCDTLAAGIERLVVPGTISFYREKPANEGVGRVPGIIHHRSRLFDPEYVRRDTADRLTRHHAAGPYAFGSALETRDRTLEGFVPDWVMDELRAQAVFEPMLTDLYDAARTPRAFQALPRQANAAMAWRDLCEDLDTRPKIVISATEKHLVAADMLIAEVVACVAARAGPDVQVICLVDSERYRWDRQHYLRKYGVVMIDVTALRHGYRMEDWYFYRFIMRLYVQFELRLVLDLGSDFFQRLFSEFHRPICTLAQDVRFFYPGLFDDALNGARVNIVRGADLFARTTGRFADVLSAAPAFARFVASETCRTTLLGDDARAGLRTAELRRFATDPQARAIALIQADLGRFLLAPLAPALIAAPMEPSLPLAFDDSDTGRTHGRVFVITAGDAAFSRDLLDRARAAFAADPTVDVLIPQIVFWQDAEESGHRFVWLDPKHVVDRIAGCADLMVQHKIAMPFFAMFHDAGASLRHYKRLSWRDYDDDPMEFLRELYELASAGTVQPLEAAVCVARNVTALDVRTIGEHV